MLKDGYVILGSDGYVRPDERFMTCLAIDDWTPIPVPQISMKINQ